MASAEHKVDESAAANPFADTTLAEQTMLDNHDLQRTWNPMLDYQMMSRNVKGFMSLFHANKPVLCKVELPALD